MYSQNNEDKEFDILENTQISLQNFLLTQHTTSYRFINCLQQKITALIRLAHDKYNTT